MKQYVGKSLIWMTVEKHRATGLSNNRAIIKAASELGMSYSTVYRGYYKVDHVLFETFGYTCDESWLDRVITIIVLCNEMTRKLKYTEIVSNKMLEQGFPVDPNSVDAIKTLLSHTQREIDRITPSCICVQCAEYGSNPDCEKCHGTGWISSIRDNHERL